MAEQPVTASRRRTGSRGRGRRPPTPEHGEARRAARAALVPPIRYPDLPVVERKDDIAADRPLRVAIVGAAYVATSGQTRLTSRSADMDALATTGEGILDYAFGQWKVAMDENGLLNAAAANAHNTPFFSALEPMR